MPPAHANDSKFAGTIPQLYERYLVPLIFEPYAVDISRQVARLSPGSVLELAAGTGVVTRHLASDLPADVSIVASDLNQPMLDVAAQRGTARPVTWRQADAMQLPFPDQSFDVVVCQFGVMFFPDRAKAYAEAARVLRPGGYFVFNAWDRIENNDMVSTVCGALDELFPQDPPRFMHRGPHGYFDRDVIAGDLARGGLPRSDIALVPHTSRAPSANDPVLGYCHGSPLRTEIEAKGPDALDRATDKATAALLERFGSGPVEGRIQAVVAIARA
ncbi:class I SAM-dependent methyltransferase [Caenimonas aquaedulcis]|uniref:Class I SAM-dependent methyltransferase n=1 Tax=Caenimonas aquaedulcis TaxID=2793270 RepID=A0A931MIW4_9BURK|nr:class I SAM-dependent methyltransferase [Caenimonas aquaedulcis]MBG9390571.1 class I SAM-dependent methyltransferase [Caenimonas aquaedulcis]